MKRISTLLFVLALFVSVSAQDKADKKKDRVKDKTEKVKKEKTEKVKKEKTKKEKGDKVRAKDDASIFISQPENSEDYQLEDRREVTKPEMPVYDEIQGFNQKGKKKTKQQEAYMNEEYYFPAKPKNAWQLGVRGGLSQVNGDINQNFFKGNKPFVPGYTFGVTVAKPFSYMFSMRLNYDFMEMWNTDWQRSTLTEDLIRHTDYDLASYINNNPSGSNNLIFHNSHTVAHDMTLDAVVSFGNVRFHKERTKVIFNVFVSGGGFLYQTWYDHLDENGDPYDYRSIAVVSDANGVDKKDVINALNDMRNGVYETQADGHPDTKNGAFLKDYSFRPVMGGGVGMVFRLNRIMNLELQTRMMFTRDDLVDGHRWQEPDGNSSVNIPNAEGGGSAQTSRGLTRDFDTYTNTTMGLTFKLVGKNKTESTTLLNPMHYSYQKLAEADPESAIDDLLQDDDGDGVPNRLDLEADTPEGAPVDPKGRALDSDKDGIIDLLDEEPFSPPGYPINENGIAQIPQPEKEGASCSNCGIDCEAVAELPSVHFDKDKYYIRPEFYSHMHNVAEMMLLCPDMKIKATGMTDKDDNEKYNEQLSWNRVNAVIDYITEKYGIERSRFIVNYDGESAASGSSSIEQYRERKVSMKVAGSGDAGDSNPAAPHPGIKAGSDK